MSLLRLPTELGVLVMTHLETPRDLFAFVRTARPIWHVFQGVYRAAILEAVIRNAFPGDNVRIAVAACEASQISKPWFEWSSTPVLEQGWDKFCKDFPQGYAPDRSSLCEDWNQLVSLSKLSYICDYFIARFEQDALSLAASKLPRQESSSTRRRSITISERTRLQRAFLRFEIYRRVTPGATELFDADSRPVYSHMRDFLRWFPPWEREEVLSVQEFLVEFSKNMCRRLQDYIALEISSAAKDMAMEPSHEPFLSEPPASEPPGLLEVVLSNTKLDVIQNSWETTRRRFQYFVARGLPFLRWLFHLLSPGDQIAAIIYHSEGHCTPSLFEVVLAFQSQIDARVEWDESYTGTLKGPNQGWMWAKEHGITTGTDSLCARYDLRRMGYVFWDTARICQDWKLPSTSPSMIELPPRTEDDDGQDWFTDEPGIDDYLNKHTPILGYCSLWKIANGSYTAHLKMSKEMQEKIGDNGYLRPFSDEEAELLGIEY